MFGRVFRMLAFLGFGLSLIVHFAAHLGIDIPIGVLLHLGIFLVWIPAMGQGDQIDGLGPPWARKLQPYLFGYLFVNFFGCLAYSALTQTEPMMNQIAGGHWMLFYLVAGSALWSREQQVQEQQVEADAPERRCATCNNLSSEQVCPVCIVGQNGWTANRRASLRERGRFAAPIEPQRSVTG